MSESTPPRRKTRPEEHAYDVFETERLQLRELTFPDAEFLHEMLGDAETMGHWPAPLDREQVMQWITRQHQRYRTDGCGYWLAANKETGEPVGQAGVMHCDVEGESLPCLGYIMHKSMWRRGYATEAARGCCDFVFNVLNRDAAYTLIQPANEASLGVAEKLGMTALRCVQYADLEHVLLCLKRSEATV